MKPLHLACFALLASAASLRADTLPGKSQGLTSPDQIPDGLAKADWHSIRAAYEAARHAFQAVEGGWQARNPGQQWITEFDGRGFVAKPKDANWQWGLEFKSYGFGERQTEVGDTATVRNEGQRLSYQWDDSVQEWFVNDARGLEHGFTITRRPAADKDLSSSGMPLSFTIASRGSLRPSVSSDALTVYFRDSLNAPVLNYSGLKVWDADGRILTSRFEAAGENQIRLLIEEVGARYPLTIDPIAQQAFLKMSLGPGIANIDDDFGEAVAVAGDTVVVGASGEDSSTSGVNQIPDENALNSGAAYVFTRSGTTWSQQAYLKASNPQMDDQFGSSVAISGDTVVVGAAFEDSSTTGVNSTPNRNADAAGAAYVFIRSGTTWSQQAYLKANNTGAIDFFGSAVAVSGDTVVVGAFLEDSSTTGVNSIPDEGADRSGAAYVFTRSGTTWSQQAYLKASNTGALDYFGNAVAVSGDTVVVGAFWEDGSTSGVNSIPDEGATDSGATYVFTRSGTTWSQQAYLKANNTGEDDEFGFSVAISGDTVIVGAVGEASSTTGVDITPNDSAEASGAAYVFTRSGTTWSQQAYLKASNTDAYDLFGESVAVSGDTVVVGASWEDSGTTGVNSIPDESATDSGAAYVFTRSATTWSQQAYLKASNTGTDNEFGSSVAISGDTLVIGAYLEDSRTMGVNSTPNNSAETSGAAYVFTRSGTAWGQQAFMKMTPSLGITNTGDGFGFSVAISGDTAVVGAAFEDSNTKGVDSPANESATDSGAVYVFTRSGTAWIQQAYLKASNTGAGDQFGSSLAISGDTLVVGALKEDSFTKGVNSTSNEGATDSGAAYVFTRSGATWSQQAYLKASNTGPNYFFGSSVAVSGETVVVGALQESSGATGVNSPHIPGGLPIAGYSGAAYVFTRSGTTWSQQAYLKASNTGELDYFGRSVAVSGDTVVVGAYGEDGSTAGVNQIPDNNATNAGAAYVFTRSGTTWTQQAYIKAINTKTFDAFGSSVAVSGDTMVVGAESEDSNATGVNGTPSGNKISSGAAYVFTRKGTVWSQQAYLKASIARVSGFFGSTVSISGETVVVGAQYDASSTTGVNSIPNDLARFSGAAYVFTRSGINWSQQAYLKASNTGVGDQFGYSVAVSDDTVIIGAPYEASSTMGVNGTPNDSAANSGAAYIFTGLAPPPVAPAITVSGNGSVITDGDNTPSTADYTDFGSVATASGSITKTFTISNVGSAALNLTGSPKVAVSGSQAGDFNVTLLPTSPVAEAGGSTSFTVTFDPSVIGLRTASVSIANDDTTKNPFIFSIQGTGLNTAPVITSNGGSETTSINLAENSMTVTTITATDVDLPAQALSYGITGGADAAKFSIDSSSGVVAFASAPDFENPTDVGANNGYDLTVTVTDNGTPPNSISQAISVTITNVNEAPTDLALSQTSVIENSPANSIVGTFSSTDPDAGNAFSYSLVSGSGSTDNAAFTIMGAALRINSPPVIAIQSSYAIRIRSTDSGGMFFEKPFAITIIPVVSFSSWAATVGLTGLDAEFAAVPFNDGIENLLKYAFNMNAAGPDVSVLTPSGSSGLPQIIVDTSGAKPALKVTFLRRKGSGLIYTPQRSDTLGDFVAMTGTQTVTSIDSQWERISVQEPAPPATAPNVFARVQVSLP